MMSCVGPRVLSIQVIPVTKSVLNKQKDQRTWYISGDNWDNRRVQKANTLNRQKDQRINHGLLRYNELEFERILWVQQLLTLINKASCSVL